MFKFKSLNHFVQHNKHYHTKVLLSSLDLNGHAFGIHLQTQKLEPPTFYSVINSITEKYRFAYSYFTPLLSPTPSRLNWYYLFPLFFRWVLLKNVHLAPQWLVTLEKKLHTLNPHAAFRLFMTMEINPKVYCWFCRLGELLFNLTGFETGWVEVKMRWNVFKIFLTSTPLWSAKQFTPPYRVAGVRQAVHRLSAGLTKEYILLPRS